MAPRRKRTARGPRRGPRRAARKKAGPGQPKAEPQKGGEAAEGKPVVVVGPPPTPDYESVLSGIQNRGDMRQHAPFYTRDRELMVGFSLATIVGLAGYLSWRVATDDELRGRVVRGVGDAIPVSGGDEKESPPIMSSASPLPWILGVVGVVVLVGSIYASRKQAERALAAARKKIADAKKERERLRKEAIEAAAEEERVKQAAIDKAKKAQKKLDDLAKAAAAKAEREREAAAAKLQLENEEAEAELERARKAAAAAAVDVRRLPEMLQKAGFASVGRNFLQRLKDLGIKVPSKPTEKQLEELMTAHYERVPLGIEIYKVGGHSFFLVLQSFLDFRAMFEALTPEEQAKYFPGKNATPEEVAEAKEKVRKALRAFHYDTKEAETYFEAVKRGVKNAKPPKRLSGGKTGISVASAFKKFSRI